MTDTRGDELHFAGEGLQINIAVAIAGAWWTVAEVIRRHPEEVQLFETVPIDGGGYRCLALYRSRNRDKPYVGTVVHLNLANSACHITSHEDDPVTFNWTEVVLAPNRRSHVIEPIERVLNLNSPTRTPQTVRSTIAYRVMAAFMARAAFSGSSAAIDSEHQWLEDAHWRITQGFFEGHFQEDMYAAFPGLPLPPDSQRDNGEQPRWFSDSSLLPPWFADHWFVIEKGKPRIAIDVRKAKAWNSKGELDLVSLFEQSERSIDHVTTVVMPPTS